MAARLRRGARRLVAVLRTPLDPLPARVVASVSAVALAAALVSVLASVSASDGFLRAEATRKLPALLEAARHRAELWATGRRLDVRDFAGSARLGDAVARADTDGRERARAVLAGIRARHAGFRSLWLVDARGSLLAGVGAAGAVPGDVAALATRAPAARWSERRRRLLVAEPAAGAVLVAAVGPGALARSLAALPLGPAALYLVGDSGAVIARAGAADGRARERPLETSAEPPLRVEETERADGGWVRSARRDPRLGWTFVVQEPVATAVAPGRRFVRRVLGVNLATAGAFVVLALLLSRTATAPLRALYRDARRIAGAAGGDDLGVVARAFRDLRARARNSRRELREKQREVARANERLRARNEDLQRANEVLARLSVTDELTRLHNHRHFREILPRELKRALRTGAPLSLVLFDIDDFKALNDRHGHAVGDAILARVAEVMKSAVREVDLLARYGGEEFALLAPGTPRSGAAALAEKIRLSVSGARFSVIALEGPQAVQVTVSAGVATFRGDERAFFHDADRALYRAKAAGKDCVVVAE